MSGQPVRRVWGIRSVTRPAVTWDVIEIQPAHQNQGGNPELLKSVERGRVRFILRDVVPTPLTPGETSIATLAEVRRHTSGDIPRAQRWSQPRFRSSSVAAVRSADGLRPVCSRKTR